MILCTACGDRMPDEEWDEHIQTEKHSEIREASFIHNEIFDSVWGTKHYLCVSVIPKRPFNKLGYEVRT